MVRFDRVSFEPCGARDMRTDGDVSETGVSDREAVLALEYERDGGEEQDW